MAQSCDDMPLRYMAKDTLRGVDLAHRAGMALTHMGSTETCEHDCYR